jgi:hypothetical protein
LECSTLTWRRFAATKLWTAGVLDIAGVVDGRVSSWRIQVVLHSPPANLEIPDDGLRHRSLSLFTAKHSDRFLVSSSMGSSR